MSQILGQQREVRIVDDKSTSRTAFGDLQVGELCPIFQGIFEYTVDNTELLINTAIGSGSVTQANGMGVVGTSNTTGSSALMRSKQHGRYHSGLGGLSRFTAMWSEPVDNTEMYIGIAGATGVSSAFVNGYMVGYDGTTFGFHRFQNDTKFTIPISQWDDPLDGNGSSGMTIDQTKLNVFQIQFQYLGAGAINLFIEDDSTGGFVEVLKVLYANKNVTPSVYNPSFFHTVFTNNKATTNNMEIKTASYAFFIEGKTEFIELHQPDFASGIKQKTTVTSEVAILTIRNKATYASKTNFIDILIQGLSGSVDTNASNNISALRLVKNTTLGGTPSYSDINTTNSVIEIDTSGTTLTGGQELIAISLSGKNASDARDITKFRIILNPEDTLTIAGSSSGSATMNAGILWRELF